MPATLLGGEPVCFDTSKSGINDAWVRRYGRFFGALSILIVWPQNEVQ